MVPPLAPSESTDSRLLASTSRSPAATWMRELNAIAARTNWAAGRACRSTSSGRTDRALRTWGRHRASSAARTTSSIGRPAEAVTAAAIAPSTTGASTRRASLPSRSSRAAANGEVGAAEVAEHDHAVAWSAASSAAAIRSASVPSPPSADPPTPWKGTSGPAICVASARMPAAMSALCETTTIPTMRPSLRVRTRS